MRPLLARAVAAVTAVVFVVAVARPAAAQSWFGRTCAADGSACATAWATLQPGGGAVGDAAVTFNRVGATRVIAGALFGSDGNLIAGGDDLNATFCCVAPGSTLASVFGSFGIFTAPPVVGTTYYVPVGVMTLPAGDPRSAADLEAELTALGAPPPVLSDPALDAVGLQPAIGFVAVTATPEPATLVLVGGALLLAGVARRRT